MEKGPINPNSQPEIDATSKDPARRLLIGAELLLKQWKCSSMHVTREVSTWFPSRGRLNKKDYYVTNIFQRLYKTRVVNYLYSRSSMTPCQQMDEPCNTLAHSLHLSHQRTLDSLLPLTARIPAHLPELRAKNFPDKSHLLQS